MCDESEDSSVWIEERSRDGSSVSSVSLSVALEERHRDDVPCNIRVQHDHETYRHNDHFQLGDAASPRALPAYRAIEVDSLRKYDYAFILRSDNSWTYAVVADRLPEGMLFLVDARGSTKVLKRQHWSSRIRPARNGRTVSAPKILPILPPPIKCTTRANDAQADEKRIKSGSTGRRAPSAVGFCL